MNASEEATLAALLQAAADRVLAGAPDQVTVEVESGRIRIGYTTWSPALTRQAYEAETELHDVADRLDFLQDDPPPLSGAVDLMRYVIHDLPSIQKRRHAFACGLGLVDGARRRHLGPQRVRIDRTMLRMLDDAGVDAPALAARILAGHELPTDDIDLHRIWLKFGEPSVRILFDEVEGPVVAATFQVGRGIYEGSHLVVPESIPDTLAAAAAGRRLGDIVSTGVPALDERRIVSFQNRRDDPDDDDDDPARSMTNNVTLESDLVELGAPDVRIG